MKQSTGESGNATGLESDSESHVYTAAEVGRGWGADVSAHTLRGRVRQAHSHVHCRLPSGEKQK